MTEAERLNFEKCPSFRSCSASVCPLYSAIESTYYIKGDKRCSRILDYLEGKEMPEDLRLAIEFTEKKWRKALTNKRIDQWVAGRIKFRKVWEDADSE
jgi:hypothetical protein